ncbi:hypothetical protein [Burkholderia cepacia]|uniref:hypothetical protein n=1 Tax=Burkholderia cepacia TaxID=292 RepID=UPI00066732A9|nr:hypothetical protein [Burkholderia cepacia]
MSIKFRIPRYGGADAAFLGVQFKDTYILIVSVLVAFVAGKFLGTFAYLGIPFAGYHINKKYIEWRNAKLDGFVRAFLYRFGVASYGKRGFKSQRTLYIGDATVINPRSKLLVDAVLRRDLKEEEGSHE